MKTMIVKKNKKVLKNVGEDKTIKKMKATLLKKVILDRMHLSHAH